MKIAVSDITESPKNISFCEGVDELNLIYKNGEVRDFRFPPVLDVNLVYYRSGRELFFEGSLAGGVEGVCGRCVKSYSFFLQKKFEFVLTPDPFSRKIKELSGDEMGLSTCAEEEINLAPYIREQTLLALPIRPLCQENCRGLCAGCGVNLNDEPCQCAPSRRDPRMDLFRTLKMG